MEVAITKISTNGQVVIPSEVRKEAGIKPSTKFIVFNKDGNIMLKQIKNSELEEDIKLFEKIASIDKEIAEGKFTKVDSSMKSDEIDKLLMG